MSAQRALVEQDGYVACPIRGATSTERCLSCGLLSSTRRGDEGLEILCRGERVALVASEMRVTFPYDQLHP